MAQLTTARGFAICSLVVGLLLGLLAGYTDLPVLHFVWVLHHAGKLPYIEDPGPITLFALPFFFVLGSLGGVLLGAAAMIGQNVDKRLAWCAIAVNLIPLLFLIVMINLYESYPVG